SLASNEAPHSYERPSQCPRPYAHRPARRVLPELTLLTITDVTRAVARRFPLQDNYPKRCRDGTHSPRVPSQKVPLRSPRDHTYRRWLNLKHVAAPQGGAVWCCGSVSSAKSPGGAVTGSR